MSLERLQYHILPGKPGPGFHDRALHDAAYRFWHSFWSKVMKDLGTDKVPQSDEFLRQDRVTVLTHEDEVVGMHTYTFFDVGLQAQREHSYFPKYYPESFMTQLAGRGVERLMTMEYFSVAREWSASRVGLSLGSVLCSLGLKIAREQHLQGVITCARSDVPATKIAQEQGAIPLISGVTVFNAPCDLLAFFPEAYRPCPDRKVEELSARLWIDRQDATTTALPPLRSVA